MAIDTSSSQVATSALQSLPFGSIIGGPLKACIEPKLWLQKHLGISSRKSVLI